MLNPTETYSLAQLNVAEYSGLGTCPDVSEVLFGTTGSADSWNANTDLNVITQGGNNDTWVGSSIPTTPYRLRPISSFILVGHLSGFESYEASDDDANRLPPLLPWSRPFAAMRAAHAERHGGRSLCVHCCPSLLL